MDDVRVRDFWVKGDNSNINGTWVLDQGKISIRFFSLQVWKYCNVKR